MTNSDLPLLPLVQQSQRIREGGLSPLGLLEAYLRRIEALEGRLRTYITLLKEEALEEAGRLEDELRRGRYRGPLHGIPISIKDNIMTKGIRTTAGSKILMEWVPERDAIVVERLKAAGAIILGKANLHEWAKGSSTINPFYGTTKNPWDAERIAGGSSGGSAAGVIAGLCSASLGTDAAGSVRMPASLCGALGLKPTFGRIPHYGVVEGSGSWTLDTIGILARKSEDVALLLEVLAGPDPRDASSLDLPPFRPVGLKEGVKGMKAGLVREYFYEVSSSLVRDGLEEGIRVLERLGMHVEDVKIPSIKKAPIIWSLISRSEAWASHKKLVKERAQDYGKGVLHRIILGSFLNADHYIKAQRARSRLIREVDEALKSFDCLITPTTPIVAPRIDEYSSGYLDVDGEKKEVGGIYSFIASCTIPFNLTGHPALSLPCHYTSAGLPIGMQLIGRAFDEAKLLRIAHSYEEATGYPKLPSI